jgi:hypothetical protein
MRRIIGEAYDLTKTYLYIWWDDGTVTRRKLLHSSSGKEYATGEEQVNPPPQHNLTAFSPLIDRPTGREA